jgi:hypothetical protein
MSASLAAPPKLQFFDSNGNPLVGGKIYTYAAGTTTPLAAYTDSTGTTPASNPIILDSRGECTLWLGAADYKIRLTTPADVQLWVVDNVTAVTLNLQNAQGILPVASGGTGESTAADAFDALKQPASAVYSGVVELATSAEVIAGTDTQRAVTPAGFMAANIVDGGSNTFSGTTSIQISSLVPSTAKRITLALDGVSTSGTSPVILQVGLAGPAWVTSGYTSVADNGYGTPAAYTTGLGIERTSAGSSSRRGVFTLLKQSSNSWLGTYVGTNGTDMCFGSGESPGAPTPVLYLRLTTVGGTDTFDAGAVRVYWE